MRGSNDYHVVQLPCNAGTTLADLEDDQAIQQAIGSLIELSKDSLDIIAWALTELLDRLTKVSTVVIVISGALVDIIHIVR